MAAGVEPDVLCFAAATRCCCRRLDWAAAISFLETTLREGYLPTSSTLEVGERKARKAGGYFFCRSWFLRGKARARCVRGARARLSFFFKTGARRFVRKRNALEPVLFAAGAPCCADLRRYYLVLACVGPGAANIHVVLARSPQARGVDPSGVTAAAATAAAARCSLVVLL